MTPTTPIEIDGETYDRYTASLCLLVQHKPDGSVSPAVNVRLVPTRIADGQVIQRDDHARSLLMGGIAGASEDAVTAVTAILAAGQTFINGRGI